MEIIVRGRMFEDFPDVARNCPGFAVEIEKVIRRRLRLRPQDRVVLELSEG